jgi:hypothetical protein
MRHLKAYKVFEKIDSNELEYTIILDMKEILIRFEDADMEVTCEYSSSAEEESPGFIASVINPNVILFNILCEREKAFNIKDYKIDIDHLISYMKERGWEISKFNLVIVEKKRDWFEKDSLTKSQNILSYTSGNISYQSVKNPVFWINGEFKKIRGTDNFSISN